MPADELERLKDQVGTATTLLQGQLNNISNVMLPISIFALIGTIGVQAIFKLLPLWVQT